MSKDDDNYIHLEAFQGEKNNDEPLPRDEDNLTPWEQENLRYMQERGDQPTWQNRQQSEDDDLAEDDEELLEEEVVYLPEEEIVEDDSYESFADRLPNIKDQRSKVLRRRLTLIIGAFTIPLLFFIYDVSSLSKLQTVNIVGNQQVASEEILKASKLKIGNNIWKQFFDRDTYAKNVNLPQIKSATVGFSGITSFEIKVTEYQELALLFRDSQYFPILENGTVLENAKEANDQNFPILEDFTDTKIIEKTIAAYGKLTDEVKSQIVTIKYTPSASNTTLLTLMMNNGNQVLVQYKNMDSQMAFYPEVVTGLEGPHYIDMEVGIFTSTFEAKELADIAEKEQEEAYLREQEEAAEREKLEKETESSTENEE
ncbi:cell division protein FtsQ [Enterococcus sp. PF1-24]|uniref:cell division protein FtsQ/DivIB n=1 Tax=unclassified Enterococcus TaxID=2608891 RepID=UPI002474CA6F|nr:MULTISPECIES: FtsQ-type POTRA domain-containing protein [unclassified Enterococcus]MDH6364446.1 cell division protein FtsQ [Enterococcus sp. PFB1-1]MDH6401531.1 cell division protein FtsQ [Enterococcus sp. PF1-24]